jgi:hypothetical protein
LWGAGHYADRHQVAYQLGEIRFRHVDLQSWLWRKG